MRITSGTPPAALRRIIEAAGLSHHDCLERSELEERAREALRLKYDLEAEHELEAPAPEPTTPEPTSAKSLPSVRSGVMCYVAFVDWIKPGTRSYLPPTVELLQAWSTAFRLLLCEGLRSHC